MYSTARVLFLPEPFSYHSRERLYASTLKMYDSKLYLYIWPKPFKKDKEIIIIYYSKKVMHIPCPSFIIAAVIKMLSTFLKPLASKIELGWPGSFQAIMIIAFIYGSCSQCQHQRADETQEG